MVSSCSNSLCGLLVICASADHRIFVAPLAVFQKGMKLPGSNKDVLRTKSLSGPSPVGGAMGGYESQNVYPLDEFELQAAHYNIACAHAQLGNLDEVRMKNVQLSFFK